MSYFLFQHLVTLAASHVEFYRTLVISDLMGTNNWRFTNCTTSSPLPRINYTVLNRKHLLVDLCTALIIAKFRNLLWLQQQNETSKAHAIVKLLRQHLEWYSFLSKVC